MVSAFRGLNEVLRLRRGAGVVTAWKQNGGNLLVSGDSRIIRVWDAHTEAQLLVSVVYGHSSFHFLILLKGHRYELRQSCDEHSL